jgi:hypothetical protein
MVFWVSDYPRSIACGVMVFSAAMFPRVFDLVFCKDIIR